LSSETLANQEGGSTRGTQRKQPYYYLPTRTPLVRSELVTV